MFLSVEEVSKTYSSRKGDVTALLPSSFECNEGEFLCLLGPSGCGKSTLLFMLAGLEEKTGGKMLLDGNEITGPDRERGLVFQHYTLFPWLTVRENASFANKLGRNMRTDSSGGAFDRASRVDYLLDLMGLSGFVDAYPRELSGGMKQRVAIARALVNRPKLLLMDEPFGALDSQTREEMQELLLLLSIHERMTVIFVTHDSDEAIFLGSRILVFSKRPGRILEDIKVPFDRKADFSIKLDPAFLKLKRDLLDMLHSQSGASENRNETLSRLVESARESKHG